MFCPNGRVLTVHSRTKGQVELCVSLLVNLFIKRFTNMDRTVKNKGAMTLKTIFPTPIALQLEGVHLIYFKL